LLLNPLAYLLPCGTYRHTAGPFQVSVDHEVVEANENDWTGKILVLGSEGFFDEGKGIDKIMGELVRRYNITDSGGNRSTVDQRLDELVAKGILDRKSEANQWICFATPEFEERVRGT